MALHESERSKPVPACSKCEVKTRLCRTEYGRGPAFCPTLTHEAAIGRANEQYEEPEVYEFARQASIQEGECYVGRGAGPYVFHPVKTRIEETCEFAGRMGFKRIGIAFCSGLHREASLLTEIMEVRGFEVVSVVCKAGRNPKELIGITDEQKIHIGKFESMCSPIAQAMILNEEKTDFNVLVGLCVGHDSLFLKYADAFSTVLLVNGKRLKIEGGPVYGEALGRFWCGSAALTGDDFACPRRREDCPRGRECPAQEGVQKGEPGGSPPL